MSTILQSKPCQKTNDRLDEAIENAIDWLDQNQEENGFWVGMLESNSCMEAQWVIMQHFLGITDDPKYPKVIQAILNQQREDGSWEIYYQAPGGDINTTVECYAALRAAGLNPESPPLVKARQWILEHGGLNDLRVFTKFWLALIGEWPWEYTPQLPPEIILLPLMGPFLYLQVFFLGPRNNRSYGGFIGPSPSAPTSSGTSPGRTVSARPSEHGLQSSS